MKKPLIWVTLLTLLGAFLWYREDSQPSRYESLTNKSEPESTTQALLKPALKREPANATTVTEKIPDSLPQETSTSDSEKLVSILDQILDSKNDNDPRLDTLFKNLSPQSKIALQKKYQKLKAEDRNGRGTIVFLLGRELKNPQDFDFFTEVLNETPCLSLADCSKDEVNNGSDQDGHADMGAGTTLAYPQIVALKLVEKYLKQHKYQRLSADLQNSIHSILNAAKASRHDFITQKAQALEKQVLKEYL